MEKNWWIIIVEEEEKEEKKRGKGRGGGTRIRTRRQRSQLISAKQSFKGLHQSNEISIIFVFIFQWKNWDTNR